MQLGLKCALPTLLGLCACGPAVGLEPEEDSSGAASSTSSEPFGTSTGDAPEPSPPPVPPGGTTTGLDESSSEGGGSFIIDGETSCGAGLPDGVLAHCTECSLVDQDCGTGQACKPWANDGSDEWNAARCGPLEPEPAQRGEPCSVVASAVSGLDSCDVGLTCWNVDPETLEGTCAQFCSPDAGAKACEDLDEACNVANDGYLPLCLPRCDPLMSACGEGYGCYPSSEGDFVCIREGERVYLPEGFHPDCPAGTFAANPELLQGCGDAVPCCTAYCDQNVAEACGPDGTCQPYFKEAFPGRSSLGFCDPATGG